MKKETLRRLLLSMFVAVLVAGGVLFTVNRAFAQSTQKLEDLTAGGSFKGSMSQGSEPMASPTTLNYGEELYVSLDWEFPDTAKIATGDTLEYTLPLAIVFDEVSGNILQGSAAVGTYEIQGNKLSVVYTDAKYCSGTKRKSSLTFAGKVKGDGVSSTQKSQVTIKLPGDVSYVLDVVPPSAEPTIEIEKIITNASSQKDRDAHIYECYIDINLLGEHVNPYFADDMHGCQLFQRVWWNLHEGREC